MSEKNIVVGPELERLVADVGLGELQLMVLKANAEKVVQIDAETGDTLTAGLALNRGIKLAEWLKSKGIGPGDSVSVNSENRLEFVVAPIATFLRGATFSPVNPEYTAGELKHVLGLSKPKVLFCSPDTLQNVLSIRSDLPYIQHILVYGKKAPTDNSVYMYEKIIEGATEEQDDDDVYQAEPIDPEENVCTILCSSGTTGLPKGVMTTHANMTAFIDIARVRLGEILELDSDFRLTTFGLTPFFHSMGFMSMYMNMLATNLVIVISKFKTKLFFEAISKYQINTLIVPPPVLLLLIKHPLAKKYDFSTLRDIRSGAAPMGKEMEEELKNKFKLNHVSQSYGMTETTLGVLISKYATTKLGSVGQLVSGMKSKIVDDDGNALGPFEEGEICFKGPLIMKGYVNDIVATNNTIDKDGWLHTGDVAYYDNDGFFFIVDRIKELIKYKGYQVAPAELEALLLTHESVADAAVIGLPDEDAGELPLAFVVKKQGSQIKPTELEQFVASKVSRQKKLRAGVHFIDEIPKNPTGKILRRVLREKAKSLMTKSRL